MITILLAAYNGEKYISDQIDSLLSQTVQDFRLHICDDKSTDETFAIATEYAKKHPGKIFAAQNEENTGAAKLNFIKMMTEHRDDYMMLCDQDDIWLPDKIKTTLAKMQELETRHGTETPLLVHTDLRVVDEKLDTISPSFKLAMNADYKKTRLRNQVIQNTLTGCTAMYNRALAELITETPPYMVEHDWWLMLVASAFGKIDTVYEQTILYRQHDRNQIGAKDVRTLKYKINKLLKYEEVKKAIDITYLQAQSLIDVFKNKLSSEQNKLLVEYCDVPNHIKPVRWIKIVNLGVLKNGFSRKIAHFIFV